MVYFLFRRSEIVYIGQSKGWLSRVVEHLCKSEIIFDSYTFLPCLAKNLDVVERRYIEKYRPKYNKIFNPEVKEKAKARRKKLRVVKQEIREKEEKVAEEKILRSLDRPVCQRKKGY